MTSVENQLDLIYNDIDIEIRIDNLRRLKKSITLNHFLSDLDEFKHDW